MTDADIATPAEIDTLLEALQKAAGIPHLPTKETYEFRLAVSGEGPLARQWSDKPHRLLYDACSIIESAATLRQPTQSDALREALELCLGELFAPEANCSCHICPPCNDCVEYSSIREAIAAGRAALQGHAQPTQSDALKVAGDAIRGLLDITSDYNLDSEQAGRAYAALHDISTALKGQNK